MTLVEAVKLWGSTFYIDPEAKQKLELLVEAFQAKDDAMAEHQLWLINQLRDCQDAVSVLQSDSLRLRFLINNNYTLRKDPDTYGGRWFLIAYHDTGIPSVDECQRFESAEDAIDAARFNDIPEEGRPRDLKQTQVPHEEVYKSAVEELASIKTLLLDNGVQTWAGRRVIDMLKDYIEIKN